MLSLFQVYLNTWDCLNMLLFFNLLYVIIYLSIVSSMGNRTSTCQCTITPMIKTTIVLLNFAFKWWTNVNMLITNMIWK